MYIYLKELNNDNELQFQKNIPIFLKKIIIKIIKVFNITVIQNIENNNYLYIIPRISNVGNIKKIIKKSKAKKVILSKKLKKYSKELEIEEDNKIPQYFIYKILKYIQKITQVEIETQSIYFLTNVYNTQNIETITYLVENLKTVNIVTNKIKEYSKLEEKLYNNGNLIAVTNNKKKALRKANFIVNLDLNEEEISKYNINRKSIIINCTNKKISKLKCFEGIIINNIQINNENNILNNYFDYIDILENYELKNKNYKECIKIAEKVKIINLIGNNGIIDTKEMKNVFY